jgi:hypothetical protein
VLARIGGMARRNSAMKVGQNPMFPGQFNVNV